MENHFEPAEMPGDSEAISSLITTITGTEASEFLKPDSVKILAFARFDHPTAQIWLSTQAAFHCPNNPAHHNRPIRRTDADHRRAR